MALLGLPVILVALRVAASFARRYRVEGPWPFVQVRPLSPAEQVLYLRLVQALPQYVVLAQVPMSRFLRVRKGHSPREWLNRISQKSVDYLICKPDFSIVVAIELDDASHGRPARSAADLTKNRALAAAGVPLVRWHAAALPDFDGIRTLIGKVILDQSDGNEALPQARVEPTLRESGLHETHIDASNDPLIVGGRTGKRT